MACRYGYDCDYEIKLTAPPDVIKLEWSTYQTAACALVTYTPAEELKHWLRSMRLAGVQRFYLYYDAVFTSTDTLTVIQQAGNEGTVFAF